MESVRRAEIKKKIFDGIFQGRKMLWIFQSWHSNMKHAAHLVKFNTYFPAVIKVSKVNMLEPNVVCSMFRYNFLERLLLVAPTISLGIFTSWKIRPLILCWQTKPLTGLNQASCPFSGQSFHLPFLLKLIPRKSSAPHTPPLSGCPRAQLSNPQREPSLHCQPRPAVWRPPIQAAPGASWDTNLLVALSGMEARSPSWPGALALHAVLASLQDFFWAKWR